MSTDVTRKTGRVSTQLLVILVPMIAVFIVAVAGIIFLDQRT